MHTGRLHRQVSQVAAAQPRSTGGPGGPPPGHDNFAPPAQGGPWQAPLPSWAPPYSPPPWGWGPPPPPPQGPLPPPWGPPPPPFLYWEQFVQPVWNFWFNQWGFWLSGFWIPLI